MTLEELKVIITAETAGLKKELEDVKSQISKTEQSVSKSTKSMSGALAKLSKAASFTAIAVGIAKFGKAALSAASDLEEVQNVVDVSFGSMASEVDRFAKNAIASFGISEVQAKKTASTFMAMGNSMGIPAESAKNMSLQFSALAADMSSFYNVSLDTAAGALEGVFTGNARALRQFGIVLSEATLEEFRLAKGIKTSYSAMSEAQKVQLRYAYVMQATANAQGDYGRTSQSWANQVKLLSNQWKEFQTTIGGALQAIFKPVLIIINEIIAKINLFTKALTQAFGIKTEATAAGNIGTEMAEGFEAAGQQVKKVKTLLAGFDELNTVSSNNAGGGIDASGTLAEIADIEYATNLFGDTMDNVESKISDLINQLQPFITIIKGIGSALYEDFVIPIGESMTELWISIKDVLGLIGPYIKNYVVPVIGAAIGGILNVVKTVVDAITGVVKGLKQVFGGLIDFLAGIFTGDWKRVWQGIINIFKGIANIFISLLEGFVNLIPSAINGVIKGLNSITGKIGEKLGWKTEIPQIGTVKLPRLAKGGVIDSPMIAMMGEYAGASGNPEIVTPQKILKQTIDASNLTLVNAFSQMTRQIIASIENKDLAVNLDGVTIAKSVSNANNSYMKMTGTPLLV